MLDASSAPNYSNNKDIRYEAGDTISLYKLNRDETGAVTWVNAQERTLKNAI